MYSASSTSLVEATISRLIDDFIHVICDVELVDGQTSLILRPDYAFFRSMIEARASLELNI